MKHAILAPSSAARRIKCPGSRKLESIFKRESSDAAKEGTLAHEFCAAVLTESAQPAVSDEMERYCYRYIDYVQHLAAGHKLEIEKRIDISTIHAKCWGTIDAYCVIENTLHVIDFKYGFKPVDAFENWQLLEYAAGILDTLGKKIERVVFHIVQPRNFHVPETSQKWETSRSSLDKYFLRLRKAEKAAMRSDAKCIPSSECVNCSARHVCKALRQTSLNHADTTSANVPVVLDDDALGNELRILHRAIKHMQARAVGLEEEAFSKLKNGRSIPFYEVATVQSRERWKSQNDEIIALGVLFDVDLQKPVEPQFITPKQAIKTGIPSDLVRAYSETPAGATKIRAIDEKKIRQIFSTKL